MSGGKPIVVLSTCADAETAERIATRLVEGGLAACVSVVPQVRSIYDWQGKLERNAESLLVIKTGNERLEEIEEVVKEISGYEVPEVIALDIVGGAEDYLRWLQLEVSKEI